VGRPRKPVVEQPEIIISPGRPLIMGKAPRARSLSSAFLLEGQEHFESKGKGIWEEMYSEFPVEYFWPLITLAKWLKIETGQPGDFDKPRTREEALDRLERTAGPKARKALECFLEQMAKMEQQYQAENGG
jgi:hypothetical protein